VSALLRSGSTRPCLDQIRNMGSRHVAPRGALAGNLVTGSERIEDMAVTSQRFATGNRGFAARNASIR
jgi:hypothetical protein